MRCRLQRREPEGLWSWDVYRLSRHCDQVRMALLGSLAWTPWGCCLIISYHSQTFSNRNWAILSKIPIYRFNNAPTDQYDKDVGNKTSIRIVNSQVRSKPKNHQCFQVNSSGCRKTTVQVHWITSLQVRWDLFSESDPNNIQSPVLVLWPNEYNQP